MNPRSLCLHALTSALLLTSSCIFSEVEVEPRSTPQTDMITALDQGGDLGVEPLDQGDEDIAGGVDLGRDQGGPDMACKPLTGEMLCGIARRQCGPFETTDNCGTSVELSCGVCTQGDCKADGTCSICQPESDVALCARSGLSCGTETLMDNCGELRVVPCGSCGGAGEQCDAGDCICTPETNEQLCGVASRTCGPLTVTDRCGQPRQLECGVCSAGSCSADGTCSVCQPESDVAFCARSGATCGMRAGVDNCGQQRAVASCGVCGTDARCDDNACVCPTPSCSPNAQCGVVSNACGNSTTCGNANGNCTNGQSCMAGQCVCPEPTCPANAQCGMVTNACGRTKQCGTNNGACPVQGQSCTNNMCACVPESDQAFCARKGAACGMLNAADNCNVMRSAECGGCTTGNRCINNQCGGGACVPEDNAAFCARVTQGRCGLTNAPDNCGTPRCVESCNPCQPNNCCTAGVCIATPNEKICVATAACPVTP